MDADLHRLQTHAIRRLVFTPRSWIEDRWPLVFPISEMGDPLQLAPLVPYPTDQIEESDDDGWEEEMGWIEESDGFRLNWP